MQLRLATHGGGHFRFVVCVDDADNFIRFRAILNHKARRQLPSSPREREVQAC